MNTQVIAIVSIGIFLFVLGWFAITMQANDQRDTSVTTSPTPTAVSFSPEPTSTTLATTSPIPTNQLEDQVTLGFVSLENQAAQDTTFGCGDSIVTVQREVVSPETPSLEAALNQLLTSETTFTDDQGNQLTNVLAQSKLTVEQIDETANTVSVYLEGNLSLAGTCDTPRFEEQLRSTIEANSNASTFEIYINDEILEEALSAQG
jgi:hypothetical protein